MSFTTAVQGNHVLIARPSGLPGYAPREWCAVCGKTTANVDAINCLGTNCPNTCHSECLNGNEVFNCFEVSNLRTSLNIQDRVIHINSGTDNVDAARNNRDEADDELLQLGSRELVAIVRRLQTEITRKNSILSFFGSIADNIAAKRDAIVTVLEFMDNITATKSSLEQLEVKTTACSACPDKIDEDWLAATASNQELSAWWTSGKPRQLRKVCQLEKSGNSLIRSEQQLTEETTQAESGGQTLNNQQQNLENRQQQPNRQNISTQHSTETPRFQPSRYPTNKTHPTNNKRPFNSRGNLLKRSSFVSATSHQQSNYNSQSRSYCNYCRKRGHSEEVCKRRLRCEFCLRSGHQTQDCRTKQYEERQERFLRNIATEQASQNAILIQSFQRYLPQSQVSHIAPAQGLTHFSPQTYYHQPLQANQFQQNQFQQYCPQVNR